MEEKQPRAKLVERARALLRGFIIIRHEDHFRHGVPDISVTGFGCTTWWETKLADPELKSKGIQSDTMLRLATVGTFARYIIFTYDEKTGEKTTRIVHPRDIHRWKTIGSSVNGWDYKWIIENILRAHASKGQTLSG